MLEQLPVVNTNFLNLATYNNLGQLLGDFHVLVVVYVKELAS